MSSTDKKLTPEAEAEAALRRNVTLRCDLCGNQHEAHPDAVIQDPLTKEWHGVVDEPGPCQQCDAHRWRYVR